jgi:quinol monooxygenase YgiN/mannose-6-phosphate isomerase-like protein (cupin superfamily)
MSSVGRYTKAIAKPGQGEALARKLLEVAVSVTETPGCQLYLINRSPGEPDVVWVTELWRSQEELDAALNSDEARAAIPAVLELVDTDSFERIELEPLGGAGYPIATTGSTIVNLQDVEDSAAKFGFGETGEARFARTALGAATVGLSLQQLRPGARQTFGHRHALDEEVYVILAGSGRVAIDDEIQPLRRLDAVRVAPGSKRAFEAGPDGLQILATGAHRPGDAEILPGFWPEE